MCIRCTFLSRQCPALFSWSSLQLHVTCDSVPVLFVLPKLTSASVDIAFCGSAVCPLQLFLVAVCFGVCTPGCFVPSIGRPTLSSCLLQPWPLLLGLSAFLCRKYTEEEFEDKIQRYKQRKAAKEAEKQAVRRFCCACVGELLLP